MLSKIEKNFFKNPKKKNNNFPARENNISTENTNNKLVLYSKEVSLHLIEDLIKLNYIFSVFRKIIYLHYETNKVDLCIQSIRNYPIFESAFRLIYNAFQTKFNTLQTISNDRGENLALELNRSAKFFSTLTHFFELLPPPFSAVGGVIRLGISEVNKRNKVFESKNTLKYCNTYENFTKIVSLLFTCILIKNLTDRENIDDLVEKNFLVFWKILNAQAEQAQEKSSSPVNIENFWASCFTRFAFHSFFKSENSFTRPLSLEGNNRVHRRG